MLNIRKRCAIMAHFPPAQAFWCQTESNRRWVLILTTPPQHFAYLHQYLARARALPRIRR